jgi:hypothetical protein
MNGYIIEASTQLMLHSYTNGMCWRPTVAQNQSAIANTVSLSVQNSP